MFHMGPECQKMPGYPWKREGDPGTHNNYDQVRAHGGEMVQQRAILCDTVFQDGVTFRVNLWNLLITSVRASGAPGLSFS